MLKERIEKQKIWERIRWYLLAGSFWLFLILIVSLIANLPQLRVREFKVQGSKRIQSAEVINELKAMKAANPFIKYLGFSNVLFWWNGSYALSSPLIESASVETNFWDRSVEIDIKEKQGEIIWCAAGANCVWLDNKGEALEEAPFSEGQLLDIVYDDSSEGVKIGSNPLSEECFSRLKKIIQIINSSSIPLKRIGVDSSVLELRATADLGPVMIFNLRIDPAFSEAPLKNLYSKPGFGKLQYIDFSILNKVFYK